MSVESKPFYWLECDAPECGETYPGDWDDVAAYSDQTSLIEFAPESDWRIVAGKHFCPDHANWYCHKCGEALTEDEQNAGEYECFKCAPELKEPE